MFLKLINLVDMLMGFNFSINDIFDLIINSSFMFHNLFHNLLIIEITHSTTH